MPRHPRGAPMVAGAGEAAKPGGAGPWVIRQAWVDLAFAHWPVPVATVQAGLPDGLTVDTFDGRAWVSVVPFRMTGIRRRGCPRVPGLSAMPELNVRTYVTCGGQPGVWFCSLDVPSRLAVWIARRWYHLPYYHAALAVARDGDTVVASHRRRGGPAAAFAARITATGPARPAAAGSLEAFLVERYRLFARHRDGRLLEAAVAHDPWRLAPAAAAVTVCTVGAPHGLPLDGPPALAHVAERLDVRIWGPTSARR